jgi:hypothetical protein
VYFGSEACAAALPRIPAATMLVDAIVASDRHPVLVTPLTRHAELASLMEWVAALLGHSPSCEVIVNDIGVASLMRHSFRTATLGAGRLLARQLCRPLSLDVIESLGLTRLESDDARDLVAARRLAIGRTLLQTTILVSVSMTCPFGHNVISPAACPRPCLETTVCIRSDALAQNLFLQERGVYHHVAAVTDPIADRYVCWPTGAEAANPGAGSCAAARSVPARPEEA